MINHKQEHPTSSPSVEDTNPKRRTSLARIATYRASTSTIGQPLHRSHTRLFELSTVIEWERGPGCGGVGGRRLHLDLSLSFFPSVSLSLCLSVSPFPTLSPSVSLCLNSRPSLHLLSISRSPLPPAPFLAFTVVFIKNKTAISLPGLAHPIRTTSTVFTNSRTNSCAGHSRTIFGAELAV